VSQRSRASVSAQDSIRADEDHDDADSGPEDLLPPEACKSSDPKHICEE